MIFPKKEHTFFGMLDENCAALLAAINGACIGGGFKIIEEQELARCLPEEGNIVRMLSQLEEKKLIELRYAEEGTYCVRPMPAGRTFAERVQREKFEARRSRREVLVCAVLGAFFGAFTAALLVGLLELLL